MVLAKFQNDRKLKELEYELSFNKEVKANDISKEMIKNCIFVYCKKENIF